MVGKSLLLRTFVVIAGNILLAHRSHALYETHTFVGIKTWEFVTKFCFNPASKNVNATADTDQGAGIFQYNITFPSNTTLNWQVYFDGEDSWGTVNSESTLDCFERSSAAVAQNNMFPLFTHPKIRRVTDVSQQYTGPDGARTVSGELVFISTRARWFYFALGNCWSPNRKDSFDRLSPYAKEGAIRAHVSLAMFNGNGPQKQFSADEIGKLTAYTTFFVLYIIVGLICAHLTFYLKQKNMLHHTVRFLLISIYCEIGSVFFGLVYQSEYAKKGMKYIWLETFSSLLHASADIFLLFLLIVIGKGWTVVRRKISATGRVKIGVFMTAYSVTYYAVIVWHYSVGTDPAAVTYMYDSPWGFYLQMFRLFGIGWFAYACHTTKINYTKKQSFYNWFFVTGALWIAALPLQVLFANNLLPLWYRSAFVTVSELTVNLLFYLRFLMLFWPSKYNSNFPFHAKTADMAEPLSQRAVARLNKKNRSGQGHNTRMPPVSPARNSSRFGVHNAKAGTAPSPGRGSTVPEVQDDPGNEGPGVLMTQQQGSEPRSSMGQGDFGPVYASNQPSGFNRMPIGSDPRGRSSASGGAVFGDPLTRIEKSITNLRSRLTKLYDISDDIEYAIEEIRAPEDEEDQDL